MKLMLANNQSEKFRAFHDELRREAGDFYDYSGYRDLLFLFDTEGERRAQFFNVDTGRWSHEYDGVYINGYLGTPDMAVTVAVVLDSEGVGYANQELKDGLSLSKLSGYAKMAAKGVMIPRTYAGARGAVLRGVEMGVVEMSYPAVLKRADADGGIDNFKVKSADEVRDILVEQDEVSVWVLQDFIPNDGFYLVTFYHDEPKFAIFRSLEKRDDGDGQLEHIFKPKSGENATLMEVDEVDGRIVEESAKAIRAMGRQVASVDSIFVEETGKTYVLEVNYNPSIVNMQVFMDVRKKSLLDALRRLGE